MILLLLYECGGDGGRCGKSSPSFDDEESVARWAECPNPESKCRWLCIPNTGVLKIILNQNQCNTGSNQRVTILYLYSIHLTGFYKVSATQFHCQHIDRQEAIENDICLSCHTVGSNPISEVIDHTVSTVDSCNSHISHWIIFSKLAEFGCCVLSISNTATAISERISSKSALVTDICTNTRDIISLVFIY